MMRVSDTGLKRIHRGVRRLHAAYERWVVGRLGRRSIPAQVLWSRLITLGGLRRVTVECRTQDGFFVRVELGHLAEITAAVGRPEEDGMAALVRSLRPGDVMLDIGANVGRYTLMAARRVGADGRVIACEPSAEVFRKLERNIALNDLCNVMLHRCALGDKDGELELYRSLDHGRSSLHPVWLQMANAERAGSSERVRVSTVDGVLETAGLDTVHVCKIDVEGSELDVLHGATRSLAAHRILALACEVHEPLVNPSNVTELLEGFGYATRLDSGIVIATANCGRGA